MASPRSLILALYTHWEVVESLVPLTRDYPAFDQEQILAVISHGSPTQTATQNEETLRQLVNADLLRVVPRGSVFELHPLVLDFVRGLTREHELGLSEVLRARVEAIKSASTELAEALAANQADGMRSAGVRLVELFRQIRQQLDQDRHAILELAERAKAADAKLPLARRYAEVLKAYDDYVEPMAAMMDSGPEGTFYPYLEQAEQTLDHAVETLEVRGALYMQRLAMRHVAFQAKELRRLGREVLKQCSDTLLPLREEMRQDNAMAAAISALLGRIRKRGLNRALRGMSLPLWQRDFQRRMSVGDEVMTIMNEGLNYRPVMVSFPEDEGTATTASLDLVDEPAVFTALRRDAPIGDLLDWLHRQWPSWSDATTLRVYHELLQRQDWLAVPGQEPYTRALNTVKVTLYPHDLRPGTEHS